jgi:hypothetical protein
MSQTQGRWSAKTPFPDLQIFFGADQFALISGTAPLSLAIGRDTLAILKATVAAGSAAVFGASLPLLLRSGVLASPQYDQEQYGTAASVPGPSAVSGTSGPLAEPNPVTPYFQGFPPTVAAAMATLAGPSSGAQPKGIQIDSIDVIYQVLTDATAVAATVGLSKTVFKNLIAPVTTDLIILGANGLPVVIGAQPQVTNVPVISPAAMIVAADTEVLLNINLTGGTAGTIAFFGAVVKAHYNLA